MIKTSSLKVYNVKHTEQSWYYIIGLQAVEKDVPIHTVNMIILKINGQWSHSPQ